MSGGFLLTLMLQYIIRDATMLTMDSRASERRAMEPEMYHVNSFSAKMSIPPIIAVNAELFLSMPLLSNYVLKGLSFSMPKNFDIVNLD